MQTLFLILIALGTVPALIYGAAYSARYQDGSVSLRLLTLTNNVLTFSCAGL